MASPSDPIECRPVWCPTGLDRAPPASWGDAHHRTCLGNHTLGSKDVGSEDSAGINRLDQPACEQLPTEREAALRAGLPPDSPEALSRWVLMEGTGPGVSSPCSPRVAHRDMPVRVPRVCKVQRPPRGEMSRGDKVQLGGCHLLAQCLAPHFSQLAGESSTPVLTAWGGA